MAFGAINEIWTVAFPTDDAMQGMPRVVYCTKWCHGVRKSGFESSLIHGSSLWMWHWQNHSCGGWVYPLLGWLAVHKWSMSSGIGIAFKKNNKQQWVWRNKCYQKRWGPRSLIYLDRDSEGLMQDLAGELALIHQITCRKVEVKHLPVDKHTPLFTPTFLPFNKSKGW